MGALPVPVQYLALRNQAPGYYHFYIDNVVLRKPDGTLREVVWNNAGDSSPVVYTYKNAQYTAWGRRFGHHGFPFTNITLTHFVGHQHNSAHRH